MDNLETNLGTKLGFGVFTWDGEERRNHRYGCFVLLNTNYDGDVKADCFVDYSVLQKFLTKKVRLLAKVTESRKSSHVGDLFLKVFPTQPDVGEIVDLGIGYLSHGSLPDWATTPPLGLKPNDKRMQLWMDPRKLYRLHDQTVEIYVQETQDECSPVPTGFDLDEKGTEDLGDGSFQSKNVDIHNLKVPPTIEKVGDGMFILDHKPVKGRRF